MVTPLEDRTVSKGHDEHVVRFEPCPRRVRTYLGGAAVADSTRVLTMFETGHLPVYYFPLEDLEREFLVETSHSTHCPFKGDATYYSLKVAGREAENAVWHYRNPIEGAPEELASHVAFYWNKMDAWFEEDDEVFVHARDPYKRIDALHSSRHVRVEFAGVTVADTRRPVLLFETGLPTRYYIPPSDVRRELLVPSSTTTRCPYKGEANYHSVRVGEALYEDAAWYYRYPIPECPKIEGLICFYNERVDALYVDDVLQERPVTPWS